MKKMLVKFNDGSELKVKLYEDKTPESIKMLEASCPQEVKWMHARFNGEAVFFTADIKGDVPAENAKAGNDMKAGEISLWRGGHELFMDKAVHCWYGPKVAGANPENVIGEFDGDMKALNDFGMKVWIDGPCKAVISVIEE